MINETPGECWYCHNPASANGMLCVEHTKSPFTEEELRKQRAQIRLLGAAPDLLAACETIRAHLHDLGGEEEWAHLLVSTVLDPAIAKARA